MIFPGASDKDSHAEPIYIKFHNSAIAGEHFRQHLYCTFLFFNSVAVIIVVVVTVHSNVVTSLVVQFIYAAVILSCVVCIYPSVQSSGNLFTVVPHTIYMITYKCVGCDQVVKKAHL